MTIESALREASPGARHLDAFWGPANRTRRAAVLSAFYGEPVKPSNPDTGWNRWCCIISEELGQPGCNGSTLRGLVIAALRK